MPTVLKIGKFRFFFYSNEGDEPIHIHIVAADNDAKFWVHPAIKMAKNNGFNQKDLATILNIIHEHETLIIEKWYEHFKKQHTS